MLFCLWCLLFACSCRCVYKMCCYLFYVRRVVVLSVCHLFDSCFVVSLVGVVYCNADGMACCFGCFVCCMCLLYVVLVFVFKICVGVLLV